MCGIAGILNKSNAGVTEDLILMLSCMHNRGLMVLQYKLDRIKLVHWNLQIFLHHITMRDLD